MGALLQMIIKEFLQLRQDRKIIPALIVGPLAQLLALGYAANLDVTQVPLLLVDRDHSVASRALTERFDASGYFQIKGSVPTAEEAEPWLVEGLAQVVLVIPEGYGNDLAASRSPHLQVLADGTDANNPNLNGGTLRPFDERPAPAIGPQKVLYIDFELDRAQFRQRYSVIVADGLTLGNKYEMSPNFLRGEDYWDGNMLEGYYSFTDMLLQDIRNRVTEHDVKVLIIDNITFLTPGMPSTFDSS